MTGAPVKHIHNWVGRGVVGAVRPGKGSRQWFTLADAIRFGAMFDLTSRVCMGPTDARDAAAFILDQVREYMPDGELDVSAIPPSLSVTLAMRDGETVVGLTDPKQPREFADWAGDWGRAYVVVPVAALVARISWESIDVLAARRAA